MKNTFGGSLVDLLYCKLDSLLFVGSVLVHSELRFFNNSPQVFTLATFTLFLADLIFGIVTPPLWVYDSTSYHIIFLVRMQGLFK